MNTTEKLAERALNLNDLAVQKRLAAQWGYVQAPAPAPQMVLVPVYPTSEMIDAGRWSEYGEETSRLHEVDDDEVAGVWASMIAAAPSGGSEAAMFIRAREWAERIQPDKNGGR